MTVKFWVLLEIVLVFCHLGYLLLVLVNNTLLSLNSVFSYLMAEDEIMNFIYEIKLLIFEKSFLVPIDIIMICSLIYKDYVDRFYHILFSHFRNKSHSSYYIFVYSLN